MAQDVLTRRAAVAAVGAVAAAAVAACSTTPPPQAEGSSHGFTPARHAEDDWLDAVPGAHRTFIDASTPAGAGEAILYANNLYVANKSAYGLEEPSVTVVVCLRHFATAFAFNDAIWAKYGAPLSALLGFTDPKTTQAPGTNLLNSADYGLSLPSFGNTIESVTKRGTRFAVCDMATHFVATQLAQATSGDAAAIYEELKLNLIPASHLVAAGVLAVNRAQERGYTLLNTL